MPKHFEGETSYTDFDMPMLCFHLLSKLTNGLWENASLVLKQLSKSIISKILFNSETTQISELKMAKGLGQESDSQG